MYSVICFASFCHFSQFGCCVSAAVSVMYQYALRLARDSAGLKGIQDQVECLLAAMNTLRLGDPKFAWVDKASDVSCWWGWRWRCSGWTCIASEATLWTCRHWVCTLLNQDMMICLYVSLLVTFFVILCNVFRCAVPIFSTHGWGMDYCDECVCVSVHKHVSVTTCPNFTKYSVHIACNHGLVLLRRHCNTLCTPVCE